LPDPAFAAADTFDEHVCERRQAHGR
jgi:hypothetical protein